MISRKLARVALVATMLSTMSGCESTSWSVRGSYEDGPFKVEGEISGNSEQQQRMMYSTTSYASSLDAADLVLDISGTTLTVPDSGMVTLELYTEGAGSTPRVIERFPWARSGEFIFVANPQAVNAWLGQNGLPNDSLQYELDAFPDTNQVGEHTIAVSTIYDAQVKASSSHTFHVSGGGCGGPGIYCDPQ